MAKFDLRELDLPDTTWGFTLDMGYKISVAINQSLSPGHKRFVAALADIPTSATPASSIRKGMTSSKLRPIPSLRCYWYHR